MTAMRILGIETSCDETSAAVIENGTKILSNVVASSVELHKKTGGIIPEVAAREQLKCIIPVIEESMRNNNDIDALAVTVGPGLIGSLLVGVETARTLAYVWKKPLVPVNHLRAHLYANWLDNKPQFPAIGLVVSGGHTDLVLMKDHKNIKWLGGTRDDAAGECFDKTARLLGLPYPGGPAIAQLAKKGNPNAYPLPRPMLNQKNFDFSFSGLKTAAINLIKNPSDNGQNKKINRANLATSIQAAIAEVLVLKTVRASEEYGVKSILLSGGVAANQELRKKMRLEIVNRELKINLFIPPVKLCTDNAAMIASCASFNFRSVSWKKIKANPGLSIEEMV